MDKKAQAGGGIVGLIFLAVAIINFFRGENWIVWFILGALFGGLGALGRIMNNRDAR
ncbi:MAG: hypothetical protein O9293_05355 [Porphyrobacter sp.]|nr:hypothetical protein [Porphyrobacter sp.]